MHVVHSVGFYDSVGFRAAYLMLNHKDLDREVLVGRLLFSRLVDIIKQFVF